MISAGPLAQLVPVENASMPDRTVIQWDKEDLETLGLLKIDVLALGMLTAIRKALQLVHATNPQDPPLTIQDIPAEDPETYAMLQRGDSVGVFQVESRAQMAMLPRLKPHNFYDLVIEVAIVRPGPIQGDMVHPYLRRRQGLDPSVMPAMAYAAYWSAPWVSRFFRNRLSSWPWWLPVSVPVKPINSGAPWLLGKSAVAWITLRQNWLTVCSNAATVKNLPSVFSIK